VVLTISTIAYSVRVSSDHRLGPLLGRAHEAHRALAEEALAPLGLTPKAFGSLAVLAAEGPLSQQQLAQRTGIDRTTMVAVVDVLERAHAVERRRSADDRRAYALHVTRRGRRLLVRARTLVVEVEQAFLAPLEADEQRRLKDALFLLVSEPAIRDRS
jgi:DNA-binding MarR family transcriptional regulator